MLVGHAPLAMLIRDTARYGRFAEANGDVRLNRRGTVLDSVAVATDTNGTSAGRAWRAPAVPH
jgi:hypothetical protein